ncbi:hypothetical protein ACQRDX_00705 [Streptococcus sp. SGI.013]|uniref:hypothetical protein n=1 Tax=unclassified Streptococcus TaxID=2608887 RepID=UPI003D070899
MKQRFLKSLLELGCVFVILGAAIFSLGQAPKKTSLTLDQGKIHYTGYVQDDRLNGQGSLVYDTGDRYEGNFSHGSFDGKGTFTSAAGWSYQGDFKKGQAHGQGKLTLEDGRVFEGKFKQGMYQK